MLFKILQGLLDRGILFTYACRIAKYEIEQKDHRKCMNSFFSYARQLQTLREGIKTDEQKEIFTTSRKNIDLVK